MTRRLAYLPEVTRDFGTAIRVVALDGGAAHEVVRFAPSERMTVTSVAWSPDGQRLVYTRETVSKEDKPAGPAEMWAVAATAGQPVRVDLSLPRMRNLVVNPDGRRLAFQTGSEGEREWWVMDGVLPKRAAQSAARN